MDMTPAQRIRAEAKQATRRALLEAGLTEVLKRGGLEDPSIETICARAGYTRGAFYVHFEDRAQFITEMLDWVLTEFLEAMLLEPDQEPGSVRTPIERFTETVADENRSSLHRNARAGYLAIMRGIQADDTLRDRHAKIMTAAIDRLASQIRDGQGTGDVRPDLDPQQLATLITLVGVGEVLWDQVGIDYDPRTVADALVRMIEIPPST